MAEIHIKQARCRYPNQRERKSTPDRPTNRQGVDRRNKNRKIFKKCLIRKGIVQLVIGILVIIVIQGVASRIVKSITVNEEDCYKSAVSNLGEEEAKETLDLEQQEEEVQEKSMSEEKLKDECSKIYSEYSQLLVLVNKDRELDGNYDVSLKNICQGRLQASEELYADLVQMLSDAGREGYKYWIASAFRSHQRQQELVDEDVKIFMSKGMTYEQALEETYKETMPAGYSEHETGLALDILCSNNMNMDVSQEMEAANQWLQEHCYEYGFILRYPKDKVEVTKINYEPWHFRYVGKTAAEFMKKNNIVLEEFYDIIERV